MSASDPHEKTTGWVKLATASVTLAAVLLSIGLGAYSFELKRDLADLETELAERDDELRKTADQRDDFQARVLTWKSEVVVLRRRLEGLKRAGMRDPGAPDLATGLEHPMNTAHAVVVFALPEDSPAVQAYRERLSEAVDQRQAELAANPMRRVDGMLRVGGTELKPILSVLRDSPHFPGPEEDRDLRALVDGIRWSVKLTGPDTPNGDPFLSGATPAVTELYYDRSNGKLELRHGLALTGDPKTTGLELLGAVLELDASRHAPTGSAALRLERLVFDTGSALIRLSGVRFDRESGKRYSFRFPAESWQLWRLSPEH